MLRGLVLVVLLLAGVAALWWSQGRDGPPKVSGFVESDEIRLGSRVGGRVREVRAAEGAAVTAGDALVEFEAYDLAERRAQAAAQAAARRAEHARLVAGPRAEEIAEARARAEEAAARLARLERGPRPQEVDAARAQVTLAESALDLARKTLERTKSLAGRGESEEALDRAADAVTAAETSLRTRRLDLAILEEGSRREDVDAARAAHRAALAALALLEAGSRAEDVAAAAAAAEAADAQVAAIDRQIAELTVRAPIDGIVEAVDLRPGDLVAANAPVLSLADPARLWIRAYLPESRLDVKLGDVLEVTVSAFPDRRFKGRVAFVARQAEFTPGNVQTPEERAKQVFRVKVMLEDGLDVLRAGMSADVWLPQRR